MSPAAFGEPPSGRDTAASRELPRTRGVSRRIIGVGIEYAAVVAGERAATRLKRLWPECDPEDPSWEWVPLEAELNFYLDLCSVCNDTQAPFRAGVAVAFGPHAPDLARVAQLFGPPVRVFASLTALVRLVYPRLRVHMLDAWPGAVVLRLAPTAILRPNDRTLVVCGILGAIPVLLGARRVVVRPVGLSQAEMDITREPLTLRGPGGRCVELDCRNTAAEQSPVVIEIHWTELAPPPPRALDESDPGLRLDAELATWSFAHREAGTLHNTLHRVGRLLQAEARRDVTADCPGTLPTDARWRRVYRHALARVGQPLDADSLRADCEISTAELTDLTRRHYGSEPEEWLQRLRRGVALDLGERTDLSAPSIALLCGVSAEGSRRS